MKNSIETVEYETYFGLLHFFLKNRFYANGHNLCFPTLPRIQSMTGLGGVEGNGQISLDGTICSNTGIGIQSAGEIQGQAEGLRLVNQITGGSAGGAEFSVEAGTVEGIDDGIRI